LTYGFKIEATTDFQTVLIDVDSAYFNISDNSALPSASLILRSENIVHYDNYDADLGYNVFVPKKLVNQYKNDTNWCVHNIYPIPD
jgi:hypothetical protein